MIGRRLLLSTLLCLPLAAAAQAPMYQVEIIVFKTGALKSWTEEFWPWPKSVQEALNEQNPPQNSVLMSENGSNAEAKNHGVQNFRGGPSPYRLHLRPVANLDDLITGHIPPGAPAWLRSVRESRNSLLADARRRLSPQKGYQIILHRRWIQPALPRRQAAAFKLDEVSPQGDLLNGVIRFYKNRYAHVDVDLILHRVIPGSIRSRFAEHENLPLNMLPKRWPFQLHESRKIKSGEWHYLDHPLFGAIVTIQRIGG